MTLRVTLRAVVAAFLVATTVVLLPQAPATAAGCGGTGGITVVVDPNQLGGSVSAGCDADGGAAVNNFADAGYQLAYATGTGMSGFVCKVNGRPENGDCTQTNSYWSLWWSDGKTGKWVYSSRGVNSLTVPDGGYVAFSWHQGGGQAVPPGVQATPRVAAPAPAPSASAQPSKKPGAKKTAKPGAAAKPTPKPSASATPTDTPSASASATPSAKPSKAQETPSEASAAPATDVTPSDPGDTELPTIDEIDDVADARLAEPDDGGGFPAWVGILLAVVVLGAAGAVPILRRRG